MFAGAVPRSVFDGDREPVVAAADLSRALAFVSSTTPLIALPSLTWLSPCRVPESVLKKQKTQDALAKAAAAADAEAKKVTCLDCARPKLSAST